MSKIPEFQELTTEQEVSQNGGAWLTGWSNDLAKMFRMSFANFKKMIQSFSVDEWFQIYASDRDTDLAATDPDPVVEFAFAETVKINSADGIRMICRPDAMPVGSVIDIDWLVNDVSIFTTRLTIDAGEWDSLNAAAPYVLTSDPNPLTILKTDWNKIIIKTVGATTPGKNLILQIKQVKP